MYDFVLNYPLLGWPSSQVSFLLRVTCLLDIILQDVTFDGPAALGNELYLHFGTNLGLPYIEENDLCLLDEAIAMLNPPEAQVRVIEVETFLVRGSKLPLRVV